MKEKLIIKDFGPIKYVDLDFKKINVFIGPNASGKSTLSKIITIVKSANLHYHFIRKDIKIMNVLFKSLNIFSYLKDISVIDFISDLYKIHKTNNKDEISILKDLRINFEEHKKLPDEFMSKLGFSKTIFIPMERAFISTISSSLMGLVNCDVNLPKYFTGFGSNFEKARTEILSSDIDFLNINYSYQDNNDIITSGNSKTILSESASSIQSIVPLFLTIKYFTDRFLRNHLIVEEPELNLFPEAQKGLVNFLIESTSLNENSLTINTHSPYILMALNNLIEARNILKNIKEKGVYGRDLSEYEEKIKEIVKSKHLIDFDDIAVYYIHADGTAEDIKDYENRLINAEKIDSVSDIFADEADKLLDLKYDKNV